MQKKTSKEAHYEVSLMLSSHHYRHEATENCPSIM